MYEWSDIPWQKLERNIYKLQKRIYKASSREDVKTVRRLQKLLIKSWSAKLLAVRRVTQDNQGRKTAGVDGVKSLTPMQRLSLANKLKLGSKVSPTRRVWIPKPGKDEKRPLGIPTMKDRAMQGLVKLALEPEWEARFEPNSYGFRPGRSCHDAIAAIFSTIKQKSKFVLDADISQCFDKINHQKLLEKLNTYPTLRKQVRAWLKAGVMEGSELKPTYRGTPQGGTISPLLANVALHGMEESIKSLAIGFKMKRSNGSPMSIYNKKRSVSLIRYADDFLIFHEDINILNECKVAITRWLNDMGLELKPSKTRIAHTLNTYKEEKPGFDFLGFNVRQHKTGKYTCGRSTHKVLLGFKTIITPSKDSQIKHYKKVADTINSYKGKSQNLLINKLNPIIRGWCNYFATAVSQDVFNKMDSLMFWKLYKWGLKRHPIKGRKWVKNRYFLTIGDQKWVFATRTKDNPFPTCLISHASTEIKRFVKVKGNASPYDGKLVYWSTRQGRNPEMPKRTALLLKKQKGICNWCKLYFKDGDVIERDHIIPKSKGGKDEYKNWQLLHRHCHDKKTNIDGSLDKQFKPVKLPSNYKWENDMLVTC